MRIFFILITGLFIAVSCTDYQMHKKRNRPGTYEDFTLLPNGWKLTPAGNRHIAVGDLPLNLLITKDERWAITTNNGESTPSLSLIDLSVFKEAQIAAIDMAAVF